MLALGTSGSISRSRRGGLVEFENQGNQRPGIHIYRSSLAVSGPDPRRTALTHKRCARGNSANCSAHQLQPHLAGGNVGGHNPHPDVRSGFQFAGAPGRDRRLGDLHDPGGTVSVAASVPVLPVPILAIPVPGGLGTGDHDGVELLADVVANGKDPASITEETISRHLYTAGQPDPDLLIRTSGEMRVSNFLLWQIAYAEIWVTEVLWPDFRRRHLLQAIADYQKRERRYGGIGGA